MLGKTIAIGTGITTAVAAVAIAAPAGGAHSLDHAKPAQPAKLAWQVGAEARSQGLNRRYGLGQYKLSLSGSRAGAWNHALFLRSDALNRLYGLGAYAKSGS